MRMTELGIKEQKERTETTRFDSVDGKNPCLMKNASWIKSMLIN